MMVIDGHSHVTLPIEEHIKAMDEAEISDFAKLYTKTPVILGHLIPPLFYGAL